MLLNPATSDSVLIQNLYNITFVISVIVFVIVEALLLYAAIRFRRKTADDMPVQTHGNSRAELIWTVIPALVIFGLFLMTLDTMGKLTAVGSSANPVAHVHAINDDASRRRVEEAKRTDVVVEVTGRQWFWQYSYKNEGIRTSSQNDGELVLPEGSTVRLDMTASDVIHAWWVPQLGGMIYVNPKERSYVWITAVKGDYFGQCNAFCGNQHAQMISRVKVLPQAEYEAWVKAKKVEQQSDPIARQGDPARGAQVYVNGGYQQLDAINAAGGDVEKAAQASGMAVQQVADLRAYLDTLR